MTNISYNGLIISMSLRSVVY